MWPELCTTTTSPPSPGLSLSLQSLSRRHSNCELGHNKPIKSKQTSSAARPFPVRPQLSESCLQAGRELPARRIHVAVLTQELSAVT